MVKENHQRQLAYLLLEEVGFDAVVITNKEWKIEYANPAFESLSNYKREEIIGRPFEIIDLYPSFTSYSLKDVLDKGEIWVDQIKTKHRDGRPMVTEVKAFAVRNENGDICNYAFIFRDITEEVELQRRFLHAQKMQAIGTLAGGIAHDFNNILSGIMGFAELALKEIPVDSSAYQKIEQIVQGAQRAKELVRQILSFSRYTEESKKPIQIDLVIKEALKFMRAALPAEIEIQGNISSKALILADPTKIHQVIINLCTNAYQAMEDRGGILTVNLTDVVLDKDKALQLGLSPGPYVKIEVSDTGHGISPEIIDRIFEPYFTTKKAGEGTGLGLAVVYGIIKDLRGTINVHSELGKGTIFSIYLPKTERKSLPKEKKDKVSLSHGYGNILLIDDEKIVLDVEKEMLESLGYNVVACLNPYDALKEFEKHHQNFDLVITDLSMPHLSGEELSKRLLSIRPDIPIVLCTGFSELIVEEKAKDIGFKEVLKKPVSLKCFAQTLQRVLDRNRE